MKKMPTEKLSRQQQTELRKQAILQAAFGEFSQKGFALTRMEDIAKTAGVSKGSIYNYFASKEILLEELVKVKILPMLPQESSIQSNQLSAKELAYERLSYIMNNMLHSEAGLLLNLIIDEGERFPNIAKMYYNVVISKGMKIIEKILAKAWQQGELTNKDLLDCPQILVMPIVQNLIWKKVFYDFYPLDFEKILCLHLDTIFTPARKGGHEHE